MIRKIDITNPQSAKEVLNIQIPSYMVEAKLIDFYEIPPLLDTIETLQTCGESFFGYYINGDVSGVISFKRDQGAIDIHRLMVHPDHFRKGIAKSLMDFIEKNEEGIHTMTVSTGSKNIPAVKFYEKSGFSRIGEQKITEKLSLSFFQKNLD